MRRLPAVLAALVPPIVVGLWVRLALLKQVPPWSPLALALALGLLRFLEHWARQQEGKRRRR